jgi:hypothetical protein
MGIFKDNVGHSNRFYGLRVHPEYYPRNVGPYLQRCQAQRMMRIINAARSAACRTP